VPARKKKPVGEAKGNSKLFAFSWHTIPARGALCAEEIGRCHEIEISERGEINLP
jgi:hypothetical protein